MNRLLTLALCLGLPATAPAQSFTNFIRQVQTVSGIEWDVQVNQVGQQLSPLSINPGGARFELWTVRNSPVASFLLDHKYVGTYVPQASVRILSEDPYAVIPRTRADRPFTVEVTINGLLPNDPAAPTAAKAVTVRRYLQSYGEDGTGVGIDRTQATLHAETMLVNNQTYPFSFSLTRIPADNRLKVRGEERFTVMSLEDYQTAASQLASQFIQVWPVADAAIAGLSNGDRVRFTVPPIEITLNDLYPNSETWAQVYKGDPQLGQTGTVVPGSAVVVADALPQDRVVRIKNCTACFDDDGRWTIEVLTKTPFGLERLATVWFDLDRTLQVNGSLTTIE